MSDAVTGKDSQTVMDLVSAVTNAIAEHDTDLSRSIAAVSAVQDFLDKRNVPIWALLSGEMMAVPNDAKQESAESYAQRQEWSRKAQQAQLDYAGNPPVEPAGATHSAIPPFSWSQDQ